MATNALIHEKSPYLRQHAHNPVDWLPWGDNAFTKARAEQKPIFLSIGYSTCHLCHVMAHESFENESVAAVLNRDFIPVKLDREERPDVDRVYMLFVQASTGSGGWPMSVWLTPDLKPFFGGTYFPPDSRYGRPGFKELLEYLSRAWQQDRERIESSATQVAAQLAAMGETSNASAELNLALFESAFSQFRRMFDPKWGGFGGAPKFPRPVVLTYLLRVYAATRNEDALEMVTTTLHQMAAGGMHDQLGGGFHRYSVDERWFVPHFEKMLYDQAQLAIAYLEAHQITGDADLAAAARGIFTYILRDMRDTAGSFYSAEDADSPDPQNPLHSGEGAFYIWTQREIEELLDAQSAALFSRRYGVEAGGNVENDPQGEFTGRNILYAAMPVEEAATRSKVNPAEADEVLRRATQLLFAARAKRPRPHLDNKVLTSWNALMISAFAKGYLVLGDEQYKDAALSALRGLLARMYNRASGRLLRRFCDDAAAIDGFLDDYAFLAQALLDVFEITFDSSYLDTAIDLATRGLAQFEDAEAGGFYSTISGAPDLLLRMKDDYDGAEPSGNSVATDVLVRLAHLTGVADFEARASKSLAALASKLKTQPTAAPQLLIALHRLLAAPSHTLIRCAEMNSEVTGLLKADWKNFEPNTVTLVVDDHSAQSLSKWAPIQVAAERKGRITIYRCKNYTCALPEIR